LVVTKKSFEIISKGSFVSGVIWSIGTITKLHIFINSRSAEVFGIMGETGFPMLQWHELKKIVEEGALEKLGRCANLQTKYVAVLTHLRAEWDSVTDYVLVNKFGYSQVVNSDGKKAALRPNVPEIRIVTASNDFPYNFDTGMEHFILWKTGSSITNDDITAEIHRLTHERRAADSVFYINPPELRSILDLDHCHIILKCDIP
jgi:hypothetical protein